jgi:hypothetical protein
MLSGQLDMQQLRQLSQQMADRGGGGGGGGGSSGGSSGGGAGGLQVAEGVADDPELLALISRRGKGGRGAQGGPAGRGPLGGTAPMSRAERQLRGLLRPVAFELVQQQSVI